MAALKYTKLNWATSTNFLAKLVNQKAQFYDSVKQAIDACVVILIGYNAARPCLQENSNYGLGALDFFSCMTKLLEINATNITFNNDAHQVIYNTRRYTRFSSPHWKFVAQQPRLRSNAHATSANLSYSGTTTRLATRIPSSISTKENQYVIGLSKEVST